MWNSLPNAVVHSSTINQFQNRLDRHWSKQELMYVQGRTSRSWARLPNVYGDKTYRVIAILFVINQYKITKLISVFILITGITTAVINIMPLIQFMALIQCNVTLDINYASKKGHACIGPVGRVSDSRTRNQEVAGSTHTRSTASNLEQVANLLCAQANSASYLQ